MNPVKILKLFLYGAILLVLPALIIFYGGAFLFEGNNKIGMCREDRLQFKERPQFISADMLANGIAFGDYDNDGWDDMFVASLLAPSKTEPSKIYKNEQGEFLDRTKELGLPDFKASSGYFADYDNDGWLDLFVTELFPTNDQPSRRLSQIRAFRNEEGRTFIEKTAELGFEKITAETGDAALLTFADINNDGLLDIVATFNGAYRRYQDALKISSPIFKKDNIFGIDSLQMICGNDNIERVLENEPEIKKAIERDYGLSHFLKKRGCINVSRSIAPGSSPPLPLLKADDFISVHAILPGELYIFKNTGVNFEAVKISDSLKDYFDGNTKISWQVPWPFLSYKFFQSLPLDFNGDGLMDIFVATDWGRNLLLENRGNFQFEDVSLQKGFGIFGSGMGAALGDPTRRGMLDIMVTNVGRASWFRNENEKFVLDTTQSVNRTGFGWGVAFLDADNDGWTDVYFTNGTRYSSPALEELYSRSTAFYQNDYKKDAFYRNLKGVFHDYSDKDICMDTTNTFSAAVSDINRDGYVDLAVGTTHVLDKKTVTVFENKGGKNHWVQIRLHGKKSNRFGVGAEITVETPDGSKQTQMVAIGESFASQHSLTKTFGLGQVPSPIKITVHWPSGKIQTEEIAAANQLIVIEEE